MKLTQKQKDWLVANKSVSPEASDDEFMVAWSKAIFDTDTPLTPDIQKSLLVEDVDKKDADTSDKITGLLESVVKSSQETAAAVKANADEIASMKAGLAAGDSDPFSSSAQSLPSNLKEMIGGATSDTSVNVIGAEKRYDATKSAMVYPEKTATGAPHVYAGQSVSGGGAGSGVTGGRNLETQSELDKAVNGVWFKFCVNQEMGNKTPRRLRMTEHDNAMLKFILHERAFGGPIGGIGRDVGADFVDNTKLSDFQQKNLIDDAVSGGLEAAPISFDDAVITTPLLHGEFFPRVNVVNIDRGRRIEGVTMANVTVTWGGGDSPDNVANLIPLFNTAAFIAAFDTNIHTVTGRIKIGHEFMSDSPVAVGSAVQTSYGQVFRADLDRVITVGAGVTEPLGIMAALGTVAVASASGAAGPATVGDYEGMLFGVQKQFKLGFQQNDCCFGANEVTYRRARGIAVGAGDQRRVFGMVTNSHSSYMLLEHPYCINHSMTNAQAFFGVMKRYRMYRRLGMAMRVTDEGETLVTENNLMISMRGRFGGQPEDGNAFAVITDFGP